MSLECTAAEVNGQRLFTLKGRVDSSNSGELERGLQAAFDAPGDGALIDMAGLTYISSAGLRVVLMLSKRLKAGGGRLVLCGLVPQVREVFELSGFAKIIEIVHDRAAALSGAAR